MAIGRKAWLKEESSLEDAESLTPAGGDRLPAGGTSSSRSLAPLVYICALLRPTLNDYLGMLTSP